MCETRLERSNRERESKLEEVVKVRKKREEEGEL